MSNAKKTLPALFIGHGSPMNAIADNSFTEKMQKLGRILPRPEAILVISAHWETDNTWVSATLQPETIHDFYGFPEVLYKIQYPAQGNPTLAHKLEYNVLSGQCYVDDKRGLDHGAWSILLHLFPQANIPVIQLSLDRYKSLQEHYALAQHLRVLRNQGVLIIGSGNIVHNLQLMQQSENAQPHKWAVAFDAFICEALENRAFEQILEFRQYAPEDSAKLSVPTLEHFVPLLYTLAVSDDNDKITYPVEGFQYASLSMRSIQFG